MTRLKTEWIDYMLTGMDDYNTALRDKTGFDLSGLMADTYGISEQRMEKLRKSLTAAAVPVTQGEGIIGSFSDSVCAIVRSMGFKAFVTEETDVDGICSAVRDGADIIFMADDIRYLAFSIRNGLIGENNYCTALGFVMALRAQMRKAGFDIAKEKILLTGCGLVGREAACILRNHGIDFDIYDRDRSAMEALRPFTENQRLLSSPEEIKNYRFILDFTNEGGWLKDELLRDDVIYASPGVPLSLDEKAAFRLQKTAVYDNLEIGTAMMLGELLKGCL